MQELNEIIAGCLKNDRVCQEKLYRKFYPAMFCLCRKFFSDDHKALETLNDGMLKVFRALHGYDDSKGVFFNWVYTIVRNTALDKLRSGIHETEKLREELIDAEDTVNPLQKLEWKDIYTYLDLLPPATRTVFTLFYLEGFKITDISDQLSISGNTVKWHLSESRRLVQPVLKKFLLIK